VPARDPGGRHAGERRALREALARARAATEEAADALAAGVAAVDAVLPGLDAGALAVPALAAAGLHAALERAQARLAGLAPPRIGRA
jgi:hypothetical protein